MIAQDSAEIRNGNARYQSLDWHDALEKGWSRIKIYLLHQERNGPFPILKLNHNSNKAE